MYSTIGSLGEFGFYIKSFIKLFFFIAKYNFSYIFFKININYEILP